MRDFRFSGPFSTSPYRKPPLPFILSFPEWSRILPAWFPSLFLGKEVLIGEAKCYLYPFRISVGMQTKRQLTNWEQFINTVVTSCRRNLK